MPTRAEVISRTLLLSQSILGTSAQDDHVDEALAATAVSIIADANNLMTSLGQSVLTTLAGLVLGQGCQLHLVIPDIPIVGNQPPLRGDHIRGALEDYSRDLVPGARAIVSNDPEVGDLIFVIGDSPWEGNQEHAWRIFADACSGGIQPTTGEAPRITGDYGLGGSAAAVVAAVEPFKFALRSVAASSGLTIPIPELIQRTNAASIALGRNAATPSGLEIGNVDFISGGAITNAALHALLRVRNLKGRIRIIEPETVDPSNLNRYALCRYSEIGLGKAEVLARSSTENLTIEPLAEKLEDATLHSLLPLSEIVAVGADSVPSRWLAQAQWPKHLIIGATAGFMTMTSSHEFPGPCAGCLHPVDDEVNATIPTVSFVSYLAGLFVAARALTHASRPGDQIEHRVSHLWPLRLDLADSVWSYPSRPDPRCPVKCPASQTRS